MQIRSGRIFMGYLMGVKRTETAVSGREGSRPDATAQERIDTYEQ